MPALSTTAFTAAGELNSYNRDHVACKTKKIYYLVLGRKSVPATAIQHKRKELQLYRTICRVKEADTKSTHGSLFIKSRTDRTSLWLNKSEWSLHVTVNGQEGGHGRLLGQWAWFGSGGGHSSIEIYKKLLGFTCMSPCYYNMHVTIKIFKVEGREVRGEEKCPSPKVYKELRWKPNKNAE